MRKYWKRILAMVLAVAMVVPSVPMETSAAEYSDNILEMHVNDDFEKSSVGLKGPASTEVEVKYEVGFEFWGSYIKLFDGSSKLPVYYNQYYVKTNDGTFKELTDDYVLEDGKTYTVYAATRTAISDDTVMLTLSKEAANELMQNKDNISGYLEGKFNLKWKDPTFSSDPVKSFTVRKYVNFELTGAIDGVTVTADDRSIAFEEGKGKVYLGENVTIALPEKADHNVSVVKPNGDVVSGKSGELNAVEIGELSKDEVVTVEYTPIVYSDIIRANGSSADAIITVEGKYTTYDENYEAVGEAANVNSVLENEKITVDGLTDVKVSVKPVDNNHKITEFIVGTVNDEDNDGTITFTAVKGESYVVNVTTVKLESIVGKDGCVVNYIDIKNGVDVTEEIKSEAFEVLDDSILESTTLTYNAGTIDLSDLGLENEELWLPIDADVSVDGIKAYVLDNYRIDLDSEFIAGVLAVINKDVDTLLNEWFASLHNFGVKETETVKATFAGNDEYKKAEAVSMVSVKDLRTVTTITANDVEITYNEDVNAVEVAGVKVMAGDVELKDVKIEFNKEITKLDAGEHEVVISYEGDDDYKPSQTTINVTVLKADSYTNVSKITVKYGTEVNASKLIDTGDAKRIEFAAGLTVGENTTADATVYLKMSETGNVLIDAIIKEIANGKEMSISELSEALEKIMDIVEGFDGEIESEAVSTLITTLKNIGLVEGVGEVKIVSYMGEDIKFNDAGMYIVGAVVFDSNYNTSFGTNYVVITPDGYKAVLDWNVKDDNGLVRKDALATYDFGAKVVEVSEGNIADAQAHVTTFFMGIDANGEATVTYDPTELEVGVYTQIALIKDLGNTMYYAEPIQRVFAVVPQVAEVEVKDAEKVYTGKPQEAEVTVKLADGSEYDPDCLQITYVGLDVNGEVYNSTVAPTNTGAYTVLATYLEKDANGVYDHAGFDVGYMVISPAEAELDVADNEYVIYDGEEHWPTITNTKNLELVKIVADDKGNVNVILPAPYDKEKYELNAKDAADELVEILKDIYANNANVAVMVADEASANEIMNEVISRLEAIGVDVYEMIAKAMDVESIIAAAEKRAEDAVKAFMATDLDAVKEQVEATLNGIEVKNLSINGVGPIEEGVYTVSVIGYRENYKLAAARGSIEIHEHDWVAANCTTPKTCEECKETEGEALGHTWGEWYVTKKPTKHSKGEERRDCENCEVYQLRELAKLPSGGGSKHDKDDSEAKLEGVYYAVSEPVTITPAKTGDSANVIGYACAVVAAGAALLYVFLKKKRA